MQEKTIRELERLFGGALKRDVPMCEYTSFRIGGPADAVLFAQDERQLSQAVRFCAQENLPYLVMGNGSNLLVSERGVRELVLMVRDMPDDEEQIDERTIRVGAGVRLTRAAQYAASLGLSGLAFAYGIPGCVGGALAMNAGAYGGEMAQVVKRVRLIEKDGQICTLDASELQFGYRTSAISGGRIALGAEFCLSVGDEEQIREKMAANLCARKEKQPLEYPSAGSVFKRPVGYFAGALIEQAGLKGERVGGAQVSQKHAGFIVNTGDATCQDVLSLIELVRARVLAQSGVTLETELRVVGEM